MKVDIYRFKCGTRIFFIDGADNYYIERSGDTLSYSINLLGDVKVDTEDSNITYAEWLERRNTVHRAAHIENLMNIVVHQSEEEYKEGMRY